MTEEQQNIKKLFNSPYPIDWGRAYCLSKRFWPKLEKLLKWVHENTITATWEEWSKECDLLSKTLYGTTKYPSHRNQLKIRNYLFETQQHPTNETPR